MVSLQPLPNYCSQQPRLQCMPYGYYGYYEPKGLDEHHLHLEWP